MEIQKISLRLRVGQWLMGGTKANPAVQPLQLQIHTVALCSKRNSISDAHKIRPPSSLSPAHPPQTSVDKLLRTCTKLDRAFGFGSLVAVSIHEIRANLNIAKQNEAATVATTETDEKSAPPVLRGEISITSIVIHCVRSKSKCGTGTDNSVVILAKAPALSVFQCEGHVNYNNSSNAEAAAASLVSGENILSVSLGELSLRTTVSFNAATFSVESVDLSTSEHPIKCTFSIDRLLQVFAAMKPRKVGFCVVF
jgi:hypothetical protein